ncbi:glycosyltransferase family 2 protein [Arthrobacter sp. FW305-BF8]|uniref:glycosyltransferase family 2 protein n=1 Tax=Arthrobacter sp. FW305-BF8 TaxID=2879617 RepID=UPI001F268051|nr:glycosyltransferase family 2 protein [Arthrobacter sp. FW305-BF8]UKA53465.1 glycosyltransferase family 2 protein [Arthrobacter sp. FW305-BF8]
MSHEQQQAKVSAVILTLNEEITIASAINSLQWCDEIFVVDSGSRDDTRNVAEQLGATVVQHRQQGIFLISEQRNWSIQNLPIRNDWILFLDADEESTPEFQTAVKSFLSTHENSPAFYTAPAFMYYNSWLKNLSGFPNWHPRIVRRSSDVRFTGGVWEDFDSPDLAAKIPVPYIHRTNAKGLEDWIGKHIRYARWEASRITAGRDASGTKERRAIGRRIRYALGPLRKYASILHLALFRRGILDGPEAMSYLRRMFMYELLIDEFIVEEKKKRSGGQL